MRTFIRIMVLAAAVFACACTKIVVEDRTIENEVPQEPITSYVYDGVTYTVHTLKSEYDSENGYYMFLIARETEAPYSSYINFMVAEEHVGKEIDLTGGHFENRIDYVLLFEDANHYYSPYYAPKGGVIKVTRIKDGSYHLAMDIQLHDGKSLKFDYSGEFKTK